jgi:hypothetical protein
MCQRAVVDSLEQNQIAVAPAKRRWRQPRVADEIDGFFSKCIDDLDITCSISSLQDVREGDGRALTWDHRVTDCSADI